MSKAQLKKYLPYLAWAISLLATLGSLYFSEIAKFPPCILCWYQRICMYPLVIIAAVGIMRKNKDLPLYILPLSLIGMAIGIYHNLLYYNIIPESIAPCQLGISCTTKYIEWAGFITIPFLSLLAFTIINVCWIIVWKLEQKKRKVS
jgi:disulfide bond formation protein DsbB